VKLFVERYPALRLHQDVAALAESVRVSGRIRYGCEDF
jgi:hypothetical protein